MKMIYDIAILGGGPAGVDAAVRASQLGLNAIIIERSALGGVCLNSGCIPTKTLLKSAEVLRAARNANNYGIEISIAPQPNFSRIIERRSQVINALRSGIDFLLKNHQIASIAGVGKLIAADKIEVQKDDGSAEIVAAKHIIIATGARPRSIGGLDINENYIISSEKALKLAKIPPSIVIIGSGAVGCEMSYFYSAMGSKVTLVENAPSIAPACDSEVSRQLERSFRKLNIAIYTSVSNIGVEYAANLCRSHLQHSKGAAVVESDLVLSAVGVQANIENIGLEALGIVTENGKIKVDANYRTNVASVFAVGDVIATPALAHVASAEARLCVEYIAGVDAAVIDYNAVPMCIYGSPEVGCVGMSEQMVAKNGIEVKIGRAMFAASGKAHAMGEREGFVKLIFDANSGELVGAHCIGGNATELLGELTMAVALHLTARQIAGIIHAHPTMYEAIGEAARQAEG